MHRHTVTLRLTPSVIYVATRSNTASEILRARTNLSRSPSEPHKAQVSVWSIVISGECLISAWNLCSTELIPFFRYSIGAYRSQVVPSRCLLSRTEGNS